MRVVVNPKACYGCRACELVCAYHHRDAFGPGGGSIKVDKDNRTGKIRLSVDPSCNLCEGRGQPLCVQYCSYKALTVKGRKSA